jgi:hypothetical protein
LAFHLSLAVGYGADMAEDFSAPQMAAGPPLGTQTVYYRGHKWFDDIEQILQEEGKVGFGIFWKSLSKSSAYASDRLSYSYHNNFSQATC